jgi:hypothetical protein
MQCYETLINCNFRNQKKILIGQLPHINDRLPASLLCWCSRATGYSNTAYGLFGVPTVQVKVKKHEECHSGTLSLSWMLS